MTRTEITLKPEDLKTLADSVASAIGGAFQKEFSKLMGLALRNAAILAVKPFLSISEAALLLGVSRATIDRLILSGALQSYRIDPSKRKLFLIRTEIDQAVMVGRVIPASPFED